MLRESSSDNVVKYAHLRKLRPRNSSN